MVKTTKNEKIIMIGIADPNQKSSDYSESKIQKIMGGLFRKIKIFLL